MRILRKPAAPPATGNKQPPAALFKNSLRGWQARYRATHAPSPPVTKKRAG
jgi:hypothetical protein